MERERSEEMEKVEGSEERKLSVKGERNEQEK